MKKIAWVTPDYFVDCDIEIIPGLLRYFSIHWVVIMPMKSRFHEEDFDNIRMLHKNLTIEFVYEKGRQRSPANLLVEYQLVKTLYCVKTDVIYLNIAVNPWFLTLIPFLRSKKTVVTAHQGNVHIGMPHKSVATITRKMWYGHFKNVNMFSKSQAVLFKKEFPSSKVFQFVLGLKDFGPATNCRPSDGDVRFLSFGTLNYTKSIDTLIDAACLLYERGVKGFKVSINGSCKDWSWYQQRIKYPEIFELDIRMINNSEIPNLFNGAHYLVQPYRVVSQSGPTKIAFQYNLPVLTSNLPGFMDEVVEGVNGYTFETGNVVDLADKMQMLIENHVNNYALMLKREKTYTEEHFSLKVLINKYIDMFNEVVRL